MTRRCFRAAFASGIAFLSLAMLSLAARAELIVFDPTNFSQNVLTAARELQQVNNEIQSLEGPRTIENQEQAQVQLSQFLNYGPGYQPQTVQMFH